MHHDTYISYSASSLIQSVLQFAMPDSTHSKAAIAARDAEAVAVHKNLSKKQRTAERAWYMGNQRNLARADRESKIYQQIDAMHEELRMYRQAKAGFALPKPTFKAGQSVLHWWASWMKTATQTPATYNTKHRPAWYSAEVCTYDRFGSMRYAGQLYTENLYNVY